VHVVKGSWTEEYINELEQTEFNSSTFDDQADATSDAFYTLHRNNSWAGNIHIPTLDPLPQIQSPLGATLPSSGLTIPTGFV
jgi:hypothetical protein